MTATEMSLNDELKAYARKQDRRREFEILRIEMRELFSDYGAHLSMLFERTHEKLEQIAAKLDDISQRLPRR